MAGVNYAVLSTVEQELFDCVFHEGLCGGPDSDEYRSRLLAEICSPDWDECDILSWKHYIPAHLRDRWASLGLEAKIVAYMLAEESREGASRFID